MNKIKNSEIAKLQREVENLQHTNRAQADEINRLKEVMSKDLRDSIRAQSQLQTQVDMLIDIIKEGLKGR